MKCSVHIRIEIPHPTIAGKFIEKYRNTIEFDNSVATDLDAFVKSGRLLFGLNSVVHFDVVPYENC